MAGTRPIACDRCGNVAPAGSVHCPKCAAPLQIRDPAPPPVADATGAISHRALAGFVAFLAVAAAVVWIAVYLVARAPTEAAAPAPVSVPVSYTTLSDREWALLVKNPDAYKDQGFVVYACITQFDSATGTDSFRANAAPSVQDDAGKWLVNGTNAVFVGNASRLSPFVAGDVVQMQAIGGGSMSYDTTIGGKMSAPMFGVVTISAHGSCK